MGNADDKRTTRQFDAAQLAALTKQPLPDDAIDTDVADPPLPLPRTTTLDDPMTTRLLAEVARRSQTSEFDDDAIDGVLGDIDRGDTTHPHTRRRAK